MIVGEYEVQGQVRRAYERALEAGTTGPLTNRLFGAALATGKRVRTETALASGPSSLSSVAVELARQVLGDLEGRGVLVLGSGETAELTARPLAERGAQTIFVASRRHERALALAARHGGRAVGFDALPVELEAADIVVAATASPHAIIGPEELGLVMDARSGRPLLVIDLAVPRDIDPACCGPARGHALRHRRPPGGDRAQPLGAQGRGPPRRGDRRGGDPALRPLAGHARRGAHDRGAAPARRRGRRARAARERLAVGDAVRRATASGSRRWRARSRSRLLHEPTLRLKRSDGDRAHARLQVLRELFALDEAAADEAADDAPAEVRELRRGSGWSGSPDPT